MSAETKYLTKADVRRVVEKAEGRIRVLDLFDTFRSDGYSPRNIQIAIQSAINSGHIVVDEDMRYVSISEGLVAA